MGIENFSRITNWISLDNLTAIDLNAEFNNLFTNLGAPTISGASGDPATLSGMQATEDPGAVGSENLPVTIQNELRELRYMVKQIVGAAQWYSPVPINLTDIDGQLSGLFFRGQNRIISGAVTADGQPDYLVPVSSANGITFLATATNFRCYIDGTITEFTADITASPLAVAPTTQNTCVVLDATLSGQQSSLTQGEDTSIIQISTIGTSISALAGKYAAFSVNGDYFVGEVVTGTATPTAAGLGTVYLNGISVTAHGLNDGDQVIFSSVSGIGNPLSNGTTYFAIVISPDAFYVSATPGGSIIAVGAAGVTSYAANASFPKRNCIQNCFRGFFLDDTSTPIGRAAISSGDTITLQKLTWVFLTNPNNTPNIIVTYNQPYVSANTPIGASIGDFWLDLTDGEWKQYNGASWLNSTSVFIGYCVQSTTETVGARSVDFDQAFSASNTVTNAYLNSSTIQSISNPQISVYGGAINFFGSVPQWNTSNNLDSGVSLTTNTQYYCYVSNTGSLVISNIAPYNRVADLYGYYHEYKPWRCVGTFSTDGSSNIVSASSAYQKYYQSQLPPNCVGANELKNFSVGTDILANRSVTPKKLSSLQTFATPLDSGNYTTTSGSDTLVTNLQLVGIPVIGGRGIRIELGSVSTTNSPFIGMTVNGTTAQGLLSIYIGVNPYRLFPLFLEGSSASPLTFRIPACAVSTTYIPTSDTQVTVSLFASTSAGATILVNNVSLIVTQL